MAKQRLRGQLVLYIKFPCHNVSYHTPPKWIDRFSWYFVIILIRSENRPPSIDLSNKKNGKTTFAGSASISIDFICMKENKNVKKVWVKTYAFAYFFCKTFHVFFHRRRSIKISNQTNFVKHFFSKNTILTAIIQNVNLSNLQKNFN